MSQPETHGDRLALGTKQLVTVWLLGGVIEWTAQYLNRWLSPTTAGNYLPFEAVVGGVCAVLFVLWRWPRVFMLSRIKPSLSDLVVGVPVGYLASNVTVVLIGRSAVLSDWALTNPARKLTFVCGVMIIPVVEELIYRAAILGSLSERTSTFWAVVITAGAATVMHDSWLSAFPVQVLLCATYLIQRRSLPASIIAHSVANAVMFAPNLLLVFHL